MLAKLLSPRRIPVYAAVAALLWLADPTPPTYAVGCALALVGILLRIWATGHLRNNQELTTTGPYAYAKHPLYLGTFLISLGGIMAAGSPRFPSVLAWAAIGPAFLIAFLRYYVPRKKRIEGERLARRFGDAYAESHRSVPDLMPSPRPYPTARKRPWSWRAFRANREIETDLAVVGAFVLMLFLSGYLPLR